MRSTIAYTTARILLFVAATGLLYLLRVRGLLLLGLALLISGLASYVVLSRQRDAMSGALTARLTGVRGRVSDFRTRLDEGARAEDDEDLAPAGLTDEPGWAAGAETAPPSGETARSGQVPGPGPAAEAGAGAAEAGAGAGAAEAEAGPG